MSSSTSSVFPNEEAFLQQLAQYAQQLEQQQYQWGQQQFAKNSGLTDQIVNNYLQNAGTAQGMAANDLARYEGLYQPLENKLISEANSYASPNRIQSEMGAAQAGVAQNFDAQRQNAIRDLQSYGIDPSAGRYAGLDRADRAQEAAAAAGAGNQARKAAEATGRALRSEALQIGERYPGQITNALNTSYAGNQGAENATLANTAQGANLLGTANQWGNTAASLKYPPLPGGGHMMSTTAPQSSSGRASSPGGFTTGTASPASFGSAPGAGTNYGAPISEGSSASAGYTQPNAQTIANPYVGSSSSDSFYSNPSYDYGQDAGIPNNDYSNFQEPDWSNNADYYYNSGGGYSDFGSSDSTASSGDYSSGDYNMAYDAGGDVSPTTGGGVSFGASPSGGQQTDDVPARLNAGEFVVPRDVAAWKGEEFFHKLIEKSRELRGGVTAKPTMKPATPQRPAFTSQAA